jgi:hypothetical protein
LSLHQWYDLIDVGMQELALGNVFYAMGPNQLPLARWPDVFSLPQ